MKRYTTYFLLLVGILASSVNVQSQSSSDAPRIVNIVNFIRQLEPRNCNPPRTEEVLYQTTLEEANSLKSHHLIGTYLIQYDALLNPKYQKLLKEEMARGCEVGAWWEITQPHVEAAGMTWRGRFPWDWYANVGFTTGYTTGEREMLVDVYMKKFKEVFGKYPTSVGSWFIDAHTLAFMHDKYHIVAACNCRDQVGTDGYTLWGGYWGQGYYPSRKNSYMPAQTKDGQIDVPMFRMLGSDPTYQYDYGIGGKAQGVLTLEPVYKNAGGSAQWVDWFFHSLFVDPALGFTYTQAGQENSFTWSNIQPGFEIQMPLLEKYQNDKQIRVQTLSETGKWFKKEYSVTPATAMSALTDFRTDNKKTVWFNSRFYRANLLWTGSSFRIRDIHLFNENDKSDYLELPDTSRVVVFTTLPFVDGCLWSSEEHLAGLRLMYKNADGNIVEAACSAPEVLTAGKKLSVRWKLDGTTTAFTMSFDEDQLKISCKDKVEWFMEMTALPSVQLPYTEITEKRIDARKTDFRFSVSQNESTKYNFVKTVAYPFNYAVECTTGRFVDTRNLGNGSVFKIEPDNQEIQLNFNVPMKIEKPEPGQSVSFGIQ